jgi:hypothetical protein
MLFCLGSLGRFSVLLFPLFVLSGQLCLLSVKPAIQSSFFYLDTGVKLNSYSCEILRYAGFHWIAIAFCMCFKSHAVVSSGPYTITIAEDILSTTSGGTLGSLTIHAFHADDKCDPLSLPLSPVDRHLLSLLFAAKARATPAILAELRIRRMWTSGSSATRAQCGASPCEGDDFEEVRGWCSRWMEVRGHGTMTRIADTRSESGLRFWSRAH